MYKASYNIEDLRVERNYSIDLSDQINSFISKGFEYVGKSWNGDYLLFQKIS